MKLRKQWFWDSVDYSKDDWKQQDANNLHLYLFTVYGLGLYINPSIEHDEQFGLLITIGFGITLFFIDFGGYFEHEFFKPKHEPLPK